MQRTGSCDGDHVQDSQSQTQLAGFEGINRDSGQENGNYDIGFSLGFGGLGLGIAGLFGI